MDEDKYYDQFRLIYKQMEPNLPRVTRIRLGALKKAKLKEQEKALKWICAIKRNQYDPLMVVINCMPKGRWEMHKKLGNKDLDEMILRNKLEADFRFIWQETMPTILKASPNVTG